MRCSHSALVISWSVQIGQNHANANRAVTSTAPPIPAPMARLCTEALAGPSPRSRMARANALRASGDRVGALAALDGVLAAEP